MLSNILVNTDLSKKIDQMLCNSKSTQLLSLLSLYSVGMWLYPGVIKRKIGLSTHQTYEILQEIEKCGIIESYFEIYCGNCQRSSGVVSRTFNELPEYYECELCQSVLPSVENAILIYKVIKDE